MNEITKLNGEFEKNNEIHEKAIKDLIQKMKKQKEECFENSGIKLISEQELAAELNPQYMDNDLFSMIKKQV